MADKYRVLSVKSPVVYHSASGYFDTFTDWTELELIPYLGPAAAAAIGGFDARSKILISPKANNELKPAKGDIIEMDLWMSVRQAPEMYVTKELLHPLGEPLPPPKRWRPVNDVMEDVLGQLKRLNDNLEKKQ